MLGSALEKVYAEVQFSEDDLPGTAERIFNFVGKWPEVIRLMSWSALETANQTSARRMSLLSDKMKAISMAQKKGHLGNRFSPQFIVTSLSALSTAWSPANPFARLDEPTDKEFARYRSQVVEVIEFMISAKK